MLNQPECVYLLLSCIYSRVQPSVLTVHKYIRLEENAILKSLNHPAFPPAVPIMACTRYCAIKMNRTQPCAQSILSFSLPIPHW